MTLGSLTLDIEDDFEQADSGLLAELKCGGCDLGYTV